ncbi:murein transglycosylase A [Chelatococcus albus]|nr:MltA domain-containing protein [Chelatococcus sp. SYSU_G07232]
MSAATVTSAPPAFADAPTHVGAARLEASSFGALAGWAADDHGAAFRAFRRTCEAIVAGRAALRRGLAASQRLQAVCRAAVTLPAAPDAATARAFFERHFMPHAVVLPDGEGFLTGYYEPEFDGALARTDRFSAPLLARPEDLVTLKPGESLPGLDPTLTGARLGPRGYEPYPDRAAIEDGALGEKANPLVYLDPIEAFLAHVQGSVRVRLPDGRRLRFAYDGRNGQPYASVGRLVAEETGLPPAELTTDRLVAWLRAHPADARRLMRQNRSYIFFRRADELRPEHGPLGAAAVQLVPGRSIAVDRTLWPYALPFWIEAELPEPDAGTATLRRLMIAQDTGSAILGPARADIFFGSGPEAGLRAGLVRHPGRFVVLLPRDPGEGGRER